MKSQVSETQRDYARRILKVMVYIESHLDEEMTLPELSQIASFSPYHFHRIFHAWTGESLQGYIRRLRMERAAIKLRISRQSVTEIALDVGYETHSAFSQAFRKCWGQSPKRYREKILEQALCEQLQTKTQELPMKTQKIQDVEIIQRKDTRVLFVRRTGDYYQSAPAAFTALHAFLTEKGYDPMEVKSYGIGHDDPDVTPEENVRYDACVVPPDSKLQPEGDVGEQLIPGGPHARFVHKGDLNKLPETYDFIYLEWLAQSGHEPADRPCVIEYFTKEQQGIPMDEWVCHIHLPLKG